MLMHLKRKNKTKKLEDINHNTLITIIIISNYKKLMDRVEFTSIFLFFKYLKFNHLVGVSVVRN
jgi:hypothetical protein